jgi:hypothetical protein
MVKPAFFSRTISPKAAVSAVSMNSFIGGAAKRTCIVEAILLSFSANRVEPPHTTLCHKSSCPWSRFLAVPPYEERKVSCLSRRDWKEYTFWLSESFTG